MTTSALAMTTSALTTSALVLWLSSEGKTGETRATESGVNGIGALLEFGVDDAGVDSTAQLGAVEMHVSLLEL